jgi:hypothetical protein
MVVPNMEMLVHGTNDDFYAALLELELRSWELVSRSNTTPAKMAMFITEKLNALIAKRTIDAWDMDNRLADVNDIFFYGTHGSVFFPVIIQAGHRHHIAYEVIVRPGFN